MFFVHELVVGVVGGEVEGGGVVVAVVVEGRPDGSI